MWKHYRNKNVVPQALWIAVLIAVVVSRSGAGEIRIGRYGGEFLAIGVGGRALGMGSAAVAVATDATSAYWNPAGLAFMDYPQIALMHDERFGDLINYDYGAAALPLGKDATLALSIFRLGIDGIPDTRNALIDNNGNQIFDNADRLDYDKITYFSAADWAVLLSYAKHGSPNFAYGMNVKLLHRSIGEFFANGIGFDAGIQYAFNSRIRLGVTAQDITTTLVAWNTGSNELITPTIKLGGAYSYELFGGVLTPAIDFDLRFEGRKYAALLHVGPASIGPHGGIEYDFRHVVAVRVGYSDVRQLTLGAGIHLPKLDIDYAFAKFGGDGALGNTHRISLRLTFESERFARH